MDYWYAEGKEAAWNEFQKGDAFPSIEELMTNVKSVLDLDDDDAESFALGWLARAREIASHD